MQRNTHDEGLFLSQQQRVLMGAVLDCLVPANDRLPGAGGLGVAEHVESYARRFLATRRLLSDGLKAIDVTSVRVHSRRFADLPDGDMVPVLKQVEAEHAAFFEFLIQQAYVGYYTHPTVLRARGLPLRPPQPEGYELAEFDASLLDNVRKRNKVYRDA